MGTHPERSRVQGALSGGQCIQLPNLFASFWVIEFFLNQLTQFDIGFLPLAYFEVIAVAVRQVQHHPPIFAHYPADALVEFDVHLHPWRRQRVEVRDTDQRRLAGALLTAPLGDLATHHRHGQRSHRTADVRVLERQDRRTESKV
ncbi:hypothetical protein D3C80_1483080 [compost metagenome]